MNDMPVVKPQRGQVAGQAPALASVVAVLGVLSAVAYVGAVVVGGFSYPGYSHLYNSISELTGSDAPHLPAVQALFALYNSALLAFGAGMCARLGARNPGAPKQRHALLAAALLMVIALLGLGMYFCPQDPRAAALTTRGTLHLILAGAAAFLTMLAMGLVAVAARRDRRLGKLGLYSWVSLGVTFLSGGAGVATLAHKAAFGGVFERVTIGSFLLWVVVLGIVARGWAAGPKE